MVGISVLIPVYNVEAYIEECIRSILKNTFQDFEIICVDDGSSDDSLNILERLSKEDARIKVVSQKNQGQSVARNKALELAEGKYVYFLDSDDKITENALGELYEKLEQDALDVLYFSGKSFYATAELEESFGNFKNAYLRETLYEGVYDGLELFALLREAKDYSMSPCIQIIRRELLNQNNIRFLEGIIHEDNHFSFLVIFYAKRAACVQNVYFLRRVREDSVMTTAKDHRNILGYFVCMNTLITYFTSHGFDPSYEAVIDGLLRGLKNNIKKLYIEISEEEREIFYEKISQTERMFFKSVILSGLEAETKLRKSLNKEKKALKKIKNSRTYKFSRALSAPMRKLKKMLKKSKTAETSTDGKVEE